MIKSPVLSPPVVWIASYPKSGNTWISSVLKRTGEGHGFVAQEMDIYKIRLKGLDVIPSTVVDPSISPGPCYILKTHSMWMGGAPLHRVTPHARGLTAVGYIHIYRNPLDVLLSYINYTRMTLPRKVGNPEYSEYLFHRLLGFKNAPSIDQWARTRLDDIPRESLDHALHTFSEDNMSISTIRSMCGSWIDHTQSWLAASDSLPGVSLKYEECVASGPARAKIADLFTFGAEELEATFAHTDSLISEKQPSKAKGAAAKIFYNKMRSNYFMEYFSEAAIEQFLHKHGATLREVGYGELLNN